MNRASQVDKTLISSVADRYLSDGYEVVIEPDPSAIPFDLGGYRPDLIARKGDISLIVEVREGIARTSFDQLRPLVEETKRHEGWRFILVTGQDVLGLGLQEETEHQVSWEEIGHGIEHAETLRDSGEREAAYLILWIAFERMMRKRSFGIGLPLDRLAPSVLIRQLYSQGELTMAQFDTALHCQTVRNRIVHGYREPNVIDGLGRLEKLLKELLPQWSVPSTQ